MFGNPDVGSSWNTKPVKIREITRLQVGDEEFVFNPNIEQAVSNTSLDLDNLSNDEILPFNDILQTVVYQNLQTKRRSKMSRKFQNIKQILPQKIKKQLNTGLISFKAKELHLSSHLQLLIFGLD